MSDTILYSPQKVADWHIKFSHFNTGNSDNVDKMTNITRHTYVHTHNKHYESILSVINLNRQTAI